MSGWTPGPWKWSTDALWGAETEAIHDGKTCEESGHSPAACGPSVLGCCSYALARDVMLDDEPDDLSWTPSDADRRLIAAAPDMAEALTKIAALPGERLDEAAGIARAALALVAPKEDA